MAWQACSCQYHSVCVISYLNHCQTRLCVPMTSIANGRPSEILFKGLSHPAIFVIEPIDQQQYITGFEREIRHLFTPIASAKTGCILLATRQRVMRHLMIITYEDYFVAFQETISAVASATMLFATVTMDNPIARCALTTAVICAHGRLRLNPCFLTHPYHVFISNYLSHIDNNLCLSWASWSEARSCGDIHLLPFLRHFEQLAIIAGCKLFLCF